MDAMGVHVGVVSLTVCIVLQSSFISTTANTTSPSPLLPSPQQNGTIGNIPIPCNQANLARDSLITLNRINSTRQALTATCPQYYMRIGPQYLECIEGSWVPRYESLHCEAPCNTSNSELPQNMVTRPPLSSSEPVVHTTKFPTECQSSGPAQLPGFPPRQVGPPPHPIQPLAVQGELLCYGSKWYLNGLFECTEEKVPEVTENVVPVVTSTEGMSTVGMVDEVENNCSEPGGNMISVEPVEVTKDSTFPASVVYALSALVGLLLVILLVLFICLCQLRRKDKSAKRMKKSGFKDQLSIFKKPTPLNLPPKLPERPNTVGSVGSLRYQEQEHETPKLPGQKIAEEEAEARKIEAIRSEIYEQIGKRSDLPEYIDIYQIK